MEYSLGLHNQLNNYIRQSSGRKESLYSIKSTEDLERRLAKFKEDNEYKISELEQRLECCLDLDQKIERPLDSQDSRMRKQGFCLNLQRYQDLLQCNFKEIQWVRSSRMSEDGQGDQRTKKIDRIEEQVSKLEEFILERENEQQKNLEELELRIDEQLKHIKQGFEVTSVTQRKTNESQMNELSLLQKQFTQNMHDLQQNLKLWETSSSKLLQLKIQQIQSELSCLLPKK